MISYRHEKQSAHPEEEVEEEHCVLDTGGDIGEPLRYPPPPKYIIYKYNSTALTNVLCNPISDLYFFTHNFFLLLFLTST